MDTVLLPECPKCGRRDKVMKKADQLNGFGLLCFALGFLFVIPWVFIPFLAVAASSAKKKGTYLCRNCWHVWQPK